MTDSTWPEALVERVAAALLDRRGFGFYRDPMEGGQDAYDISCDALEDARAALDAIGLREGVIGTKDDLARALHNVTVERDALQQRERELVEALVLIAAGGLSAKTMATNALAALARTRGETP